MKRGSSQLRDPDQGPRQRVPLLSAFEALAVTTEPVETVVYGPLADQEAIHQLLIKLESPGLEVVEFRRLPGEAGDPGVAAPSPNRGSCRSSISSRPTA